jgi:formylglycine-generating enzyme required for sulfatase activity
VISETEWQTAAQCGDDREYPWGNGMPPKYGNYSVQETKGIAGSMINNWQDDYAVTCPV